MEGVLAFALSAFVSLFTIINPFSAASVFHALSKGKSEKKNIKTARRATWVAFFVLVFFVFFGNYVLKIFSISIGAFKIASGILVFGIGYQMVGMGHTHFTKEDHERNKKREDISIIPLAIPMLSGPGAIATSLILMQEASGNILSIATIILSIAIVCIIAYFLLKKAHSLDKFLGKTGTKVIDKILGLIVLVMGIQFIISGLSGILPELMG